MKQPSMRLNESLHSDIPKLLREAAYFTMEDLAEVAKVASERQVVLVISKGYY